MIYTLIIWSSLCSSVDPGCETGDYRLHATYEQGGAVSARISCERDLKSWMAIASNRGFCYSGIVPDHVRQGSYK